MYPGFVLIRYGNIYRHEDDYIIKEEVFMFIDP